MQKTKILAVAPYEGMADILTDIAQSRDDIALTVQTGDLFTGRDIAMQLAHKNYDVIISRGGTAELIQSAVELPVIDISISVYDYTSEHQACRELQRKICNCRFSRNHCKCTSAVRPASI